MASLNGNLAAIAREVGEADELAPPVTIEHAIVDEHVQYVICEDCGDPTTIPASNLSWQAKLLHHIERFGCPGPFGRVVLERVDVVDQDLVDDLQDGDGR